ncbi:hypothetical protein Tco_1339575, partial [Tanacetum coccineum]
VFFGLKLMDLIIEQNQLGFSILRKVMGLEMKVEMWWEGVSLKGLNDGSDESDMVNVSVFVCSLLGAEAGIVAYRLDLPKQLSRVHSTFRVSNLKKCLSDETQVIPLDEIQIDDTLRFIKEPVKIIDCEVKRLKQSRIPIVKVHWNSRRGLESTWEREDQFQKKYSYPFAKSVTTLNVMP